MTYEEAWKIIRPAEMWNGKVIRDGRACARFPRLEEQDRTGL